MIRGGWYIVNVCFAMSHEEGEWFSTLSLKDLLFLVVERM